MTINPMTREDAQSIFRLAGFTKLGDVYELMNEYWPRHLSYAETIFNSPWWLIMTEHGPIRIGWRKKVISIDWFSTGFRAIITEDDVTKDGHSVHAWGIPKAIEYLAVLKKLMSKQQEMSKQHGALIC